PLPETLAITAATTHAAWAIALELGAVAILCCTRSGLTARAMARFRPTCRLLGLSPSEQTARQLALSWGVHPVIVDRYSSTDEMVWFAVEAAVRDGIATHGDVVVVVAGAPEDDVPTSDVVRVVRVR
ncbi:MAG: pyruvate kinase alpha/beta domain-containing protein, partial [Acidimicrobiales bacterium]